MRTFHYLLLLLPLLICGCDATEHPFKEDTERKEILVYCGATMLQPVMEIAKIVEQKKHCSVKISHGGSAHLAKAIKVNQIGEVFLPGSASYIKTLQDDGLISETVEIGHNEIALFVAKGNPKNVTPDLKNLLRNDLKVVIGADNAGAIGRATRLVLSKKGIYNKVFQNASYITTDSEGLVHALRDGKADVVLNWRATLHMKENNLYIDEIRLEEHEVIREKLVMGLLTTSKNPELGRCIFNLATSNRGKEIFSRYGF